MRRGNPEDFDSKDDGKDPFSYDKYEKASRPEFESEADKERKSSTSSQSSGNGKQLSRKTLPTRVKLGLLDPYVIGVSCAHSEPCLHDSLSQCAWVLVVKGTTHPARVPLSDGSVPSAQDIREALNLRSARMIRARLRSFEDERNLVFIWEATQRSPVKALLFADKLNSAGLAGNKVEIALLRRGALGLLPTGESVSVLDHLQEMICPDDTLVYNCPIGVIFSQDNQGVRYSEVLIGGEASGGLLKSPALEEELREYTGMFEELEARDSPCLLVSDVIALGGVIV